MRVEKLLVAGLAAATLSGCAPGYVPTGPYFTPTAEPSMLNLTNPEPEAAEQVAPVSIAFHPIRVAGAPSYTLDTYSITYFVWSTSELLPTLSVPSRPLEAPVLLPEPSIASSPTARVSLNLVTDAVLAMVRERQEIKTLEGRVHFQGQSSDGRPMTLAVSVPILFRAPAPQP